MTLDNRYLKYGPHLTPLRPAATVCSSLTPKEGSLLAFSPEVLRTPVSSPLNSSIHRHSQEPLDLSYQNITWSEINSCDPCSHCYSPINISYDNLFSQLPNQEISSQGSGWKGEVTNKMVLEIGQGITFNNTYTSDGNPVMLYERDHFHSSINGMQVVHSSPHPVSKLCFNSQDINTTIDTSPYSVNTNEFFFPWNAIRDLMPGHLPDKPNLTWSQDISILDLTSNVCDYSPCSPVAGGGGGGSRYLTDVGVNKALLDSAARQGLEPFNFTCNISLDSQPHSCINSAATQPEESLIDVGHNEVLVDSDVGTCTTISERMSANSSIISPVTQLEESDVLVSFQNSSNDQSQNTKGTHNNPIILDDDSHDKHHHIEVAAEISCGQGQGLRKQSQRVRALGQRLSRVSLSRACKRKTPLAECALGVVSLKKPKLRPRSQHCVSKRKTSMLLHDEPTLDALVDSWEAMLG